jgi:hypothetical protein
MNTIPSYNADNVGSLMCDHGTDQVLAMRFEGERGTYLLVSSIASTEWERNRGVDYRTVSVRIGHGESEYTPPVRVTGGRIETRAAVASQLDAWCGPHWRANATAFAAAVDAAA